MRRSVGAFLSEVLFWSSPIFKDFDEYLASVVKVIQLSLKISNFRRPYLQY
jgi:hypothetical protein